MDLDEEDDDMEDFEDDDEDGIGSSGEGEEGSDAEEQAPSSSEAGGWNKSFCREVLRYRRALY